jgi:hypothetical protein
MPKDEIDPEDPMELRGVALFTGEDTSDLMTECFIEEFLRLGHGPRQVLALFRNRHYTGPHMVLRNRGEAYVRAKIVEVFGWWGRVVTDTRNPAPQDAPPPGNEEGCANDELPPPQIIPCDADSADPSGAAIPGLAT